MSEDVDSLFSSGELLLNACVPFSCLLKSQSNHSCKITSTLFPIYQSATIELFQSISTLWDIKHIFISMCVN